MSVVSPLQPADGELTMTSGVTVVRIENNTVREGYELVGSRYSVLNKQLEPGEKFVAESGAMMHMSNNTHMSAFFGGFGSFFSGESIARVQFENKSSEPGFVGLTPNQPMSVIIPINLNDGAINAKRGAYFAGPPNVSPHASFLPAESCLACCCGGLPPIIQNIQGRGIGFLAAGGTIVCKSLDVGEEIIVDTHSLVAFSSTIAFDVKRVGTCLTTCVGGEGCFNTILRGPGYVYIQSVSYEKLIDFLVTKVPAGGGGPPPGDNQKDSDHHHRHHHHHGSPPSPDTIAR